MALRHEGYAKASDEISEAVRIKRFDFAVHAETSISAVPGLDDYLSRSQISLEFLDPSRAALGKVAQFQGFSFGHLYAHRMKLRWERTHYDREQALVLVVNSGRIRVVSDEVVIQRSPGVYLVPPSEHEIVIHCESSANEIVFVSVRAALIADLLAKPITADAKAAVNTDVLAPLYAFVTGVCRLPIDSAAHAGALKAVAADVVRSVVRLVVGDAAAVPRLFEASMDVIASQYPNSTLNAPELARRFGISLRTLQLEFQAHGMTVSGELRRTRAEAALRIRRENPKINPHDLCAKVGFGSLSAMFRAIRELSGS